MADHSKMWADKYGPEAAALIKELVEALERVSKRATPHVDDTDEDRRRDLYHIDSIARAALSKARAQ
jgi:hypothetical protein